MSAGYVGILSCELRFPASHSLKEKRHFLRSAKARLQNMGAAVAKVVATYVVEKGKPVATPAP